ncbi:DMT family transporter [Bordetella genomosp. 13]|uniref:DMT family transporter n=1 Tax=Bordetella genomosp. 13 TaxID=463040 RepID=UPI001C92F3EA|nr:DMT family transporter [Bordetella genomosp. 13]
MPRLALEAGLVIAWSSGFVGTRFSIDHAPAFLVVFWRLALVSLALLPWVWAEVRHTSRAVLARHACVGLLAMTAYLVGVTKGIELGVPAGLAALFADLLPMGTALLAAGVLRQRLGRPVWMGLFVGLLGVLIVTHDALGVGEAPLWAYGLPLLGMLALAVATLWQKRPTASASMGVLANLWLQCTVSAVVFALLAGLESGLAPVPSMGFAISVLWMTALPTLGGYGLYWVCLQRSSPTRVASVLYLSPALTLLWAWAMFGEPLSWLMAAGTAVSGWGVWMVVRGERSEAGSPGAQPGSTPCAASADEWR